MEQFQEEVKMQSDPSDGKDKQRNAQNDINLLSMIESRIMEVVQIEDDCKKKMPKLYQQRLPRFMRRRAASHNPKRLPKKLRPQSGSGFASKSRKSLLRYRQRTKFQKFKRILKKHSRHKYEDPYKSLLHKWFAKRFKISKDDDYKHMSHVPIHNNTKNQRNLYRQSKYGCAYISMIHLISIELTLTSTKNASLFAAQLSQVNRLTNHVTGFTFGAKALEKGRYEVAVHLYKPESNLQEYICSALVNFKKSNKQSPKPKFVLWLPRQHYQEVYKYLKCLSDELEEGFSVEGIYPRDCVRVKLLGPDSHAEAAKIICNKNNHKLVNEDIERRLGSSFGTSLGRLIEEPNATFTYYNTKPQTVDIVLKTREGRLLWHKLVKNKAHLVGGSRDLNTLLLDESFKLIPDI